MFQAQCAHHQEVKIALHNLWYHHTYRWSSHAHLVHLCTRQPPIGVMVPEAVYCNFDLLMMRIMCSKHVEKWNKLIVKQKFCASSWLITEIDILRRMVSKSQNLLQKRFKMLCNIISARLPLNMPVYYITLDMFIHSMYQLKGQTTHRLDSLHNSFFSNIHILSLHLFCDIKTIITIITDLL